MFNEKADESQRVPSHFNPGSLMDDDFCYSVDKKSKKRNMSGNSQDLIMKSYWRELNKLKMSFAFNYALLMLPLFINLLFNVISSAYGN